MGKKLNLTPEEKLARRREQVRRNMAAMRSRRTTDADAGGRATEGSHAIDEEASLAAAVAAAVALCGAPATVARTAPDAGAVAAHQEAIRTGAERCTQCPRRYKGRSARMTHEREAHGLVFKNGFEVKVKSFLESAGWRPMTSWTGHPEVGTYRAQWSFQERGGALRADFVLAVRGGWFILEVDESAHRLYPRESEISREVVMRASFENYAKPALRLIRFNPDAFVVGTTYVPPAFESRANHLARWLWEHRLEGGREFSTDYWYYDRVSRESEGPTVRTNPQGRPGWGEELISW